MEDEFKSAPGFLKSILIYLKIKKNKSVPVFHVSFLKCFY